MWFYLIPARSWRQPSVFNLAQHYIMKGDYQGAIQTISHNLNSIESIEIPILLEQRAQCEIQNNQPELALLDFASILEYPISHIRKNSILKQRAALNINLGRYDDALADVRIINNIHYQKKIQKAIHLLSSPNLSYSELHQLYSISPISPDVLTRIAERNEDNLTFFNKILQYALYYSHDHKNESISIYKAKRNLCALWNINSTLLDFIENSPSSHNSELISLISNISSIFSRKIYSNTDLQIALDSLLHFCPINSKVIEEIMFLNASLYKNTKPSISLFILDKLLEKNPNEMKFIREKADIISDFDKETAMEYLSHYDPVFIPKKQRPISLKSSLKLLGVSVFDDKDKVLSSYHQLIMKFHPDLQKHPLLKFLSEKKMKKINAAFDIIMEYHSW